MSLLRQVFSVPGFWNNVTQKKSINQSEPALKYLQIPKWPYEGFFFPYKYKLNFVLYSRHWETVRSGLYQIWFILSTSIYMHDLAPTIITVSFCRTSVINVSKSTVIKWYDFFRTLKKNRFFFPIIIELYYLHVVLFSLTHKYFSHAMGRGGEGWTFKIGMSSTRSYSEVSLFDWFGVFLVNYEIII